MLLMLCRGLFFCSVLQLNFHRPHHDSATTNPWHHGLMSVETPPTIWLADSIPSVCQDWLSERSKLAEQPSSEVDAVVVRTATPLIGICWISCLISACVGRAGVGVDHIDLETCSNEGSPWSTHRRPTRSVVEYAIAVCCWMPYDRGVIFQTIPATSFGSLAEKKMTGGRRLAEHRIGILGFGRIGQRLGEVLKVLGAEVAFHDLKDASHFPRAFLSISWRISSLGQTS